MHNFARERELSYNMSAPLIQCNNLILYKFVVDSSEMIFSTLIRGIKTNYGVKLTLKSTLHGCIIFQSFLWWMDEWGVHLYNTIIPSLQLCLSLQSWVKCLNCARTKSTLICATRLPLRLGWLFTHANYLELVSFYYGKPITLLSHPYHNHVE